MMKSLLLVTMFIVMIVPSVAGAAAGKPGAYATAFLGVSLMQDTDVTTDEYTGPLSTYNDRLESDPGVYVGGTAGYDFGFFRLEGELSYKRNEINKIIDRDTGFGYGGVDGDTGVFAFLANAFIDLHNVTPVTPYFGGGLGGATIYLSDTYGTDSSGIRRTLYTDDDETVFAYQLGGGLDIALNRQFSVDIGYRYFATNEAHFTSDWYQSKSFKVQSHNVAVGIRCNF